MAIGSAKIIADIENIEVGVRNLLGDSACNKIIPKLISNDKRIVASALTTEIISSSYMNVTPSNTTSLDKFLSIGFESATNLNGFILDKSYTLSFDLIILPGVASPWIRPLYSLDGVNFTETHIDLKNIVYAGFKRYSGTFKFPTTATGAFIRLMFPSNDLNATYKIKNIKLEEGNKPTSFIVAPEDTDVIINELNTNKVSKTDFVVNNNFGITTGTSTAYVLTLTPVPTSYIDGMSLTIIPNADSGLSATINVNGLGAKPIVNRDGTALVVGALKTGLPCYILYYNGKFYFN